jgi:hypothetical protein
MLGKRSIKLHSQCQYTAKFFKEYKLTKVLDVVQNNSKLTL